jgi:hypothetical protein
MYMHMPDLNRLLVSPTATLKHPDHLSLKPKKLDCVSAVYFNVLRHHVLLALLKKLKP